MAGIKTFFISNTNTGKSLQIHSETFLSSVNTGKTVFVDVVATGGVGYIAPNCYEFSSFFRTIPLGEEKIIHLQDNSEFSAIDVVFYHLKGKI